MQTLAKLLRSQFEPESIQRGDAYFRDGNVGALTIEEDFVSATVQGNENDYSVSIHKEMDESYTLSCSCPYFESGYNCKHLWALIREADKAQILYQWPEAEGEPETERKGETKWRGSSLSTEKNWRYPFQEFTKAQPLEHTSRRTLRREMVYVLDSVRTEYEEVLCVRLLFRDVRMTGEPGRTKSLKIDLDTSETFSDPLDREILDILGSSLYADSAGFGYEYGYQRNRASVVRLVGALANTLLSKISDTGRLFIDSVGTGPSPLVFISRPLKITVKVKKESSSFRLHGSASGEGVEWDLEKASFITRDGYICFDKRLYKIPEPYAFMWVSYFINNPRLRIPAREVPEFLNEVFAMPAGPEFLLPPDMEPQKITRAPLPILELEALDVAKGTVPFQVSFKYGDLEIPSKDVRERWYLKEQKSLVLRDKECERNFLTQLEALPHVRKKGSRSDGEGIEFETKSLAGSVSNLLKNGWQVRAQKKNLRIASSFDTTLTSGLDWFDLKAKIQFGLLDVSLPDVLAALRDRRQFVVLGDGSTGVLPDEWIEKYAPLAIFGELQEDGIRFTKSQAFLLDAWLSEIEEIPKIPELQKLSSRLPLLVDPKEEAAEPSFKGKLRPYQRVGLGWLTTLENSGFGGILADDMGLGKTIEVLAFLQNRKSKKEKRLSIVVAPKSLVFNWVDEAKRFTPNLRVATYTGPDRTEILNHLQDYDVLLTTYHTLRIDIERIKEIDFDCGILDEAQSVKNSDALVSKACRLIRARFRLAMTGTPIENSIADLFSILNFTLPGFLGLGIQNSVRGKGPEVDRETLELLARALRPFILRRTKEMVLKDLPDKVEQTLYIDLNPDESKEYSKLKDFYRSKLQKEIKADGFSKSKFHILEALLRLRQFACHPGLIDKKRRPEISSKVEVLVTQLKEVIAEGHKALVFSQFTQLLGIVRERLELEKIGFEYLDGKTRDRKERVEHFQQGEDAKIFLISLKAGGLGLNLTAADYVFILDPWWNPAVEYQAIDRSHRIGQTKKVFAYRLIARGTVEEKVLELQKSKKDLAEAIVAESESALKSLTVDDLAVLLE